MSNLHDTLVDLFQKKKITQATFSSPLQKKLDKVSLLPLLIKGKLCYQLTIYQGAQVLHRNLFPEEMQKAVEHEFFPLFKQFVFQTDEGSVHIQNVKGDARIKIKENKALAGDVQKPLLLEHNRVKNYILSEGKAYPFLVELGICTTAGAVIAKKRDKFIQVNRFLEMVADMLFIFEGQKKLKVIDFGCGKAYLTFALYYFLTEVRGFEVELIGVDVKESVLQECQEIAHKVGFTGLHFVVGKIAEHSSTSSLDMMIALHACDTATDAALAKAVEANAQVILAAPCCQHELFTQVRASCLEAILQYGLLKERFSALATEAARAQLLEMAGYKTQLLEFIDAEHTPKNILIRAVKGNTADEKKRARQAYAALKTTLNISPCLERKLSFFTGPMGVDKEGCHMRKGDKG